MYFGDPTLYASFIKWTSHSIYEPVIFLLRLHFLFSPLHFMWGLHREVDLGRGMVPVPRSDFTTEATEEEGGRSPRPHILTIHLVATLAVALKQKYAKNSGKHCKRAKLPWHHNVEQNICSWSWSMSSSRIALFFLQNLKRPPRIFNWDSDTLSPT